MNGAFELAKKVGIVMFVVITIITIARAAPLEIKIEEKVNTTVEPDESTLTREIQFTYTTNVTGYVNIINTGSDPIYDVWIALNLTNVTGNCVLSVNNTPSAVSVSNSANGFPDRINKAGVFNTSGANCFVHIPLLNTSGSVSIFYDVDDTAIGNGAPFDISEKYVPSKIPAGGNYTWTVYFNVSLNNTWWEKTALGSLSGNNVTLNITKYLSNNSSHYGSPYWTYLNLSSCNTNKGSCNILNSPYSTATETDAFNVTNVVLNTTDPYVNITFNVTGNYTNSSAAPYYIAPFGFAVFEFNLSYGNISGSYVVDVFAVGNASINVTKDGPHYSDGNTWWRGNVTITNKASGLSYVVTNVTMWATNQSSFSDYVYGKFKCNESASENTGNVICEYNSSNSNLSCVLDSTESVTLPGSDGWMNFSYDKVPIIWANATFKLIKDSERGWGTNNTTSNDYNATYRSNFIVIEKIYVVGTYLVKVTKHVLYNSSASSPENGSVFDIYLVVENIGGDVSPYVYVYDLIPNNFNESNWNDRWNDTGEDGNWVNKSSMLAGNGSQSLSLFGIYNKGHWWRLMPLNGGANGDGSYEDWVEIEENRTVVIFYQLNGTGDFRVLDAFIVGIDPMYSLNEQTSPKITLVSGAKATNYESTLVAAVFAAIGTAALIVRRNGRR
jgi:hypothetical protein